jgi:hypothetical protein
MMAKQLQIIAHGLILTSIMLGLIAAALWLRPAPMEPSAQAATSMTDFDTGWRGTKAKPATTTVAQSGSVKTSTSTTKAEGGIPDAGKQRYDMIDQLQDINRHLVDLERGLRDGSFTVQSVDKNAAKAARENDR